MTYMFFFDGVHQMPLIHIPNPLFETELEGTRGKLLPGVQELVEELGLLSGLAATEGDLIVLERGVQHSDLPRALQTGEYITLPQLRERLNRLPAEDRQRWQVLPWGWSASAAELVKSLGLSQSVPHPESVRYVNTRRFAAASDVTISAEGRILDEQFGWLCRTYDEVIDAFERCLERGNQQWVIKADISHAARNRIRGTGRQLSEAHKRWLERRLSGGQCVYVEPWVERIAECGLQWTIGGDPEKAGLEGIEFGGGCEMLTERGGEYRGSVICQEPYSCAWWSGAIDHGQRIAERAAEIGFRGAMGIDCMLLRRADRLELRVAHDINGRQTMGRLALSLKKHLRPREMGIWSHLPAETEKNGAEAFRKTAEFGVKVLDTSPLRPFGRAARLRTCLVISADPENHARAIRQLTGQSLPVGADQAWQNIVTDR